MMKNGIVVKQMKTVETLGSATVICTDKTGTITENKMSLAKLYVFATNTITVHEKELKEAEEAAERIKREKVDRILSKLTNDEKELLGIK